MEAEIIGWPVVIEDLIEKGVADPRCKRLEKPPEASPFFVEGEELWNVAEALGYGGGKEGEPEWIVWQPRTKNLVAKGLPSELWKLCHLALSPKVVCQFTIELFDAPADWSAWSKDAKRIAEVSWINRSGNDSGTEAEKGGHFLKVQSSIWASSTYEVFDGHIFIEYAGPGGLRFKIHTDAAVQHRKPVWMARIDVGGKGIDAVITGSLQRSDGSPFPDHSSIQRGNKVELVSLVKIATERQVAGGGELGFIPVYPGEVDMLWRGFFEKDAVRQEAFKGPLPRIKHRDAKVPDSLKKIGFEMGLDLYPLIVGTDDGPASGPPSYARRSDGDDDFLTYDLARGAFVFFTRSAKKFEMMRSGLFLKSDLWHRRWAMLTSADGRLRVIGRYQRKFGMDVEKAGEALISFHTEPRLEAEGEEVSVSVDFSDRKRDLSYKGEVKMVPGVEKKLSEKGNQALSLIIDELVLEN